MNTQLASAILMVRPSDFAYNEQTAADNEFQHRPDELQGAEVRNRAIAEFDASVAKLQTAGIEVLVLDKAVSSLKLGNMPDAVFPNNWLATEEGGTVVVFPMATPNRRAELEQLPTALALLQAHRFGIEETIHLAPANEDTYFLEGTGSLVLDRENRIAYAARSVRTHGLQLEAFIRQLGYKEAILFDTSSSKGLEFYHTNVMMSIGLEYAVVCAESIVAEDRERVLDSLEANREVLYITLEQAEMFFCANILQITNQAGEPITVMSQSAYDGFLPEQIVWLQRFGQIVTLPIPTIEHVGGGSARCMMAEIFLPKQM